MGPNFYQFIFFFFMSIGPPITEIWLFWSWPWKSNLKVTRGQRSKSYMNMVKLTSSLKIFYKRWERPVKVLRINTLRPRQNDRHFADDIFKCIFLNENTSISINISLKFVPEGLINNIQALVQIMAWLRLGDKPLSEPMMVSLLTHICITRPQ